LAQYRDYRCKRSFEVIVKSLDGNYRDEHLFALRQALRLYETYQELIGRCDEQIEQYLTQFASMTEEPAPASVKPHKPDRHAPQFDVRAKLYRVIGVDLTRIDGISVTTALRLVSELGTDMTRWATVKHFTLWLGLCPGTKKSGGRVLSSKTKPSANRAAAALRLAASSLYHSQSALGAYFRRMTARLGRPKAVTATAHKLARLVCAMLKYGTEYTDQGAAAYEAQHRDRMFKSLTRRAKALGYELVATPAPTAGATPDALPAEAAVTETTAKFQATTEASEVV
jgi:transposase